MYYTKRMRCVKCHAYISDDEYLYCDGVCPSCGYNSGDTLNDVYDEIGHWEKHGIWPFRKKIWVPRDINVETIHDTN